MFAAGAELRVGGEAETGTQVRADVGKRHAEAAVPHDQPFVGVKQGEALADGLERVVEIGAGPFGIFRRLAEPGVRAVEQIQRLFEVTGSPLHLLLQHGGTLKMRVGFAAVVGGALHARHERLRYLQQLRGLPLRRVGRVDQRVVGGAGHRRSRGG